MKRAPLLAAAALCACGELGTTLDLTAEGDVPALDSVRVLVPQGDVLVSRRFTLEGHPLPQTLAVTSKGLTRGTVTVVVQGLRGETVEALGATAATLQPGGGSPHARVVLKRSCLSTGACGCETLECASLPHACGRLDDGCGGLRECGGCAAGERCVKNQCVGPCTPRTCAGAGALCGLADDGCGGTLDCGTCPGSLVCGGGTGPNTCGPGSCTAATCQALWCGRLSDGCADVLDCGGCDAGGCGAGGTPNRCACDPLAECPADTHCGRVSDGCGGELDCGGCDGGVCVGDAGAASACCTPLAACPPGACADWDDGCGGVLHCGNTCTGRRVCVPPSDGGRRTTCECTPPNALCGPDCIDVTSDVKNCGACGNACADDRPCRHGVCPCSTTASNNDGHCCPAGWTLGLPGTMAVAGWPRCYRARPPMDLGDAADDCRNEVVNGFGAKASALGTGARRALVTSDDWTTAVPLPLCGFYWLTPSDPRVAVADGMHVTATPVCDDTSCSMCTCTTCSCVSQSPEPGCTQPFFCVMDALTPAVDGPCTEHGQCPAGQLCINGDCTDAGAFCAVDSDCTTPGGCAYRGSGQTGLCN